MFEVFFSDETKLTKGNKKGKKDEVFDRENTSTHVKGILEEYFMSEDKQEASLCTTELQSKLPKENDEVGLHLLISQGLSIGAEKKDKERSLLEDLFKHMYEEKYYRRMILLQDLKMLSIPQKI